MINPISSTRTGYASSDTIAAESSVSGVSWGAIIGGAFAASAITLILMALGSGIGLASVSPYANDGASAKALTLATVIWLIVVQWLSAGLGGYLTGRLRTKWAGLHTHEVFFRDTAHGFLAWAVGMVVGGLLLVSAVSSVISGATHGAMAVATGAAAGAGQMASKPGGPLADPNAYLTDRLFRSDHPDTAPGGTDAHGEVTRILLNGVKNGDVPQEDKAYLAQLVSIHTGLSQPDAQKRVDDVIGQAKAAAEKAKQAADEARKAAAKTSIFTALALLIGAFIASAAAALGGRHRDEDQGILVDRHV